MSEGSIHWTLKGSCRYEANTEGLKGPTRNSCGAKHILYNYKDFWGHVLPVVGCVFRNLSLAYGI